MMMMKLMKMMMNLKLTIELVPKTAWYKNVRTNVSKLRWDEIRHKCYTKAGHVCEICTGVGPNHPVECHEIWHYDDDTKRQTLIGLIALCPDCHTVKHPGYAQIKGRGPVVTEQLMKVNKMTHDEAMKYIAESFEIWRERSQSKWRLDTEFIKTY